MNANAQKILSSFDLLPPSAQQEVAFEILRRTRDFNLPPLTDDDLIANAEAAFLELDQQELADEQSKSR
jgi:hypothetical protein